MAIIFNRPRIVPFNPDSDPIVLNNPTDMPPARPTIGTPSSSPLPIPTKSMTDLDSDETVEQKFNRLYQPEHKYIDMMDQQIQNMPVRNHPGLLRKVFAGLAAGLGGGASGYDTIAYYPYHHQLADFEEKLKPIETAAGIERQNNANMRMVANQIVSQDTNEKRFRETVNRNDVLERQGDQRISDAEKKAADTSRQADERIRQADARIQLAREMMNGGKLEVDDNGVARILRKDGTVVPFEGKYLSEEEKNANRIKVAAASAGARAKATAANQRHRVGQIEYEDPENPGKVIKGSIDLDTGEITPGTVAPTKKPTQPTAVKGQSELEKNRAVLRRANEVRLRNPKYNKYITVDKGVVNIKRPGFLTGPSEAEYNEMYKEIYQTEPPKGSTATPGNTNTNTATGNTPPPIEKRTKGMEFKFPNGNVGVWDGTKWVPKTVVTK